MKKSKKKLTDREATENIFAPRRVWQGRNPDGSLKLIATYPRAKLTPELREIVLRDMKNQREISEDAAKRATLRGAIKGAIGKVAKVGLGGAVGGVLAKKLIRSK